MAGAENVFCLEYMVLEKANGHTWKGTAIRKYVNHDQREGHFELFKAKT